MKNNKIKIAILAFFLIYFSAAVFAQTCGDAKCDAGENSCNCAQDCGSCEGDVPGQSCKQYTCQEDICSIVSVANCCGNESCEEGENYKACASDCIPKSIEIEILSPLEEKFFRGEEILLKVKITADGRAISSPSVKANGFFGEISLFNDGLHDDDLVADNIFASKITVLPELEKGMQVINVQADFIGVSSIKEIELDIDPTLIIQTDLKNEIELGQNIEIFGTVLKKEFPVQADFEVKLLISGQEVLSETGLTDKNGFFEVLYHSSLLDRVGNWDLIINATDSFNNTVLFEKPINVKKPEIIEPLNIEILGDFKKKYTQGEEINFNIQLVNDSQELAKNASVVLTLPNKEQVTLVEINPGNYSRSILVSRDFKAGFNSFKIEATHEQNSLQIKDTEQIILNISGLPLKIEIIEPSNLNYRVGEKMELKIKVTDFEGEPVNNASVISLVNGKELLLELSKIGIYSAFYEIQPQDEGEIKIEFSAVDAGENSGIRNATVTIGGKEFFYDIVQNIMIFGAMIIILLVAGTGIMIYIRSIHNIKSNKAKIRNLNEREKQVQEKYFHEHSISKEEYQKLINEIEEELKVEKSKLQENKKH